MAIIPCTNCKYRAEREDGIRTVSSCKSKEKEKGFHYDYCFYHHRCDNYEKGVITTPSREEIIKALQTIQDVCKNNSDCCKKCIFYNKSCLIQEPPTDWKINNPSDEWKALL